MAQKRGLSVQDFLRFLATLAIEKNFAQQRTAKRWVSAETEKSIAQSMKDFENGDVVEVTPDEKVDLDKIIHAQV